MRRPTARLVHGHVALLSTSLAFFAPFAASFSPHFGKQNVGLRRTLPVSRSTATTSRILPLNDTLPGSARLSSSSSSSATFIDPQNHLGDGAAAAAAASAAAAGTALLDRSAASTTTTTTTTTSVPVSSLADENAASSASFSDDASLLSSGLISEAPDLMMEQLKSVADTDPIGRFLFARWPKMRRLWTKADFLHAHAISGTIFIPGATLWLIARVVDDFAGGSAEGYLAADSSLSLLLTVAGVVNALTAIPMARFSSDKMFDLSDLKGNGFSLGGTGLTCMCAWMAWWFSGSYPALLHGIDAPLVVLFSLLCVATTVNWEVMVQQNFEGDGAEQRLEAASATAGAEASGRGGGGGAGGATKKTRQNRKFAAALKEELSSITADAQVDNDGEVAEAMAAAVVAKTKQTIEVKKWLYRVASWPNLTQILFMSSIFLGSGPWLHNLDAAYPDQTRLLYDYAFSSMLGYSLSMFAETLRDRKLIGLEVDFAVLALGVFGPTGIFLIDAAASGAEAQWNPAEYWAIFNKFTEVL